MAANRDREQRRLQRLRGAGTRQIKDVDFDLGFPSAPIPPLRRSPRTPKPELPTRRSSARKLVPKSSQSKGGSTRRTTRSSTPKTSPSYIDADTLTKRRRIQKPLEANPFSATKTPRSRGRPRIDIYEGLLAEPAEPLELPEQSDDLADPLASVRPGITPRSTIKTPSSAIAIEILSGKPENTPGNEQIPQAESGKDGPLGASLQSALVDKTPNFKSKIGATTPGTGRSNLGLTQGYSILDEVDELSPDHHETGGGKISVYGKGQEQDHGQEREQEREQEEAEPISDAEAAIYLSRKRKRGPRQMERSAEGLEQHKSSKPKPSQNLSKRRKSSKSSPAMQRQPKTRNANSRETVPVVVHRLTKGHVYDEDDSDADILNADVPFARRSGVSTVDVLAQFCDEVIESGLEALEKRGSNAEDLAVRREYRTTLGAVEEFQEELRTRFLELAILLDTDFLLHKRVRAAQKERIRMREDLLRIRAERERVALEMDEVRIKYESSNNKAQEQTALSASLHDIEVAISLGSEKKPTDRKPSVNLNTLLKSVANDVSNKGSTGGILSQVKDFNGFLERAALALEGRT